MRKGQDAVSRIKQPDFHSISFKYHGMDYGFAGWWLLQWGCYSSEGIYPRFIAQGEKIYKTKEEFLADPLFDGKTLEDVLSEITDIDITINPFGPICNWEGTKMISREMVFEDMRKIRKELDSEAFPEVCRYLDNVMEKRETPYVMASNLVECDKPKVFPGFLVEYITTLYELEIEDGNHYAMNDLGARFYGGDRGFEQDFGKAMDLYHMAAENGNRQAQENLGYCYYYGRDGKPDYKKAFHYFALGAFDGHPISLYKIGDMYKNGYYVEKNPKEAFIIYNHCLQTMPDDASKYVSGPVHLRLGDMCLNGIGTEQNPQQALLHFNIAEIMLLQMVQDGDYMYKNSLREAIEGQKKARTLLMEQLPGGEWTFDD